MTTLLVLTAGQSDVQLVIDGVRHELEPGTCGMLHDEIERRGYRLMDVPCQKAHGRKGELGVGELTLCTPKLDAVLRYFDDSTRPTAAVIFDTCRTLESDPRLAGAVLERRLQECGVRAVRRHAILAGQDRLEDVDDPRDAVVRRELVQGVREVLDREFARLQPDRVVAATTGGLAAANAVIEELVRLHALRSAEVQILEVADGRFTEKEERAVPERFHPAAGFRARWQALALIEGGNLLGAWGAVSHLVGEPGQEWTTIVDWLRCFASSLPIPSDCDLPRINSRHTAVRAALRVELALRAGDVPRAIHGTVAFFESALWDGLNERIERSPERGRRRYFRIKSGGQPIGKRLLREGDGSAEDRKRPFEEKETIDGVTWYWIHDGDGGPAVRLAQHFLEREHLVAFAKVLDSEIRALRNDVVHGEATPELIEDARSCMHRADLWSTQDTFLDRPRVQAVLRELGEPDAENLLNPLLVDVRRRLVTPGSGLTGV